MEEISTVIARRYSRWIVLLAGGVIPALLGLSCDEVLPPREEPPPVLSSVLTIVSAANPIVIRNGLPAGTMGAIQVSVTNVYDDVLQDSSILEGRVEVWMKDNPDVRAVILLTESDLVTYNLLNGGTLTIGVDTTLIMLRQWSHRTVSGVPVWEYVDLFPGVTPGGEGYCMSKPITFVVRCSLRVFKSYGQIQFPDQEIPLIYQVFGIQCRNDKNETR
jgi:hypothetical protein